MAKKKRLKKNTVFIALEGYREEHLLRYLKEVFDPENKIQLKYSQEKGGSSNAVLDRALKNNYYKKVYAWFDEDNELDDEYKRELERFWNIDCITNITDKDLQDKDLQDKNVKMKNPIIIVSNPYSVESIIIKLFDKKLPNFIIPDKSKEDFEENKKRLKSSVKGFIFNTSDIEYYRNNLTKEQILEKANEIKELKLLLTIFE